MNVIGLSAFYHDSAATLIVDGEIIAAAQEERFSRIKHDPAFPKNAILYCLKEGNLRPCDLDFVVFYEKPFLKFERLLQTYMAYAPFGLKSFLVSMPLWIKDKLFQKKTIIDDLREFDDTVNWRKKLLFSRHHESHAASAFFPSPFKEAVIITIDGVGEWTTSSICVGTGNKITTKQEITFPHSIGLLYSAFTHYVGFKVNSGEYKLMGLAPYGKPIFYDLILRDLIDVRDDGSFFLSMKYFGYCKGLTMITRSFERLFGVKKRISEEEPIAQFHMDVAASIQKVTEEILVKITTSAYKKYKLPNLCLAGGVALNCVANGRILKESGFKNVWVQPAAGDAGGALGAAYFAYYQMSNSPRNQTKGDLMKGSYLGPSFTNDEIRKYLLAKGAIFLELDEDELVNKVVCELCKGKIVGWFQGRMEFGPRALGARSILADPRNEKMQKTLNLKIKFRESFRPFAPSILSSEMKAWFDCSVPSPYMQFVAKIKKKHRNYNFADKINGFNSLESRRSSVPAITHVDFSARFQTVHRDTNSLFHKLITQFKQQTECPMLVNTSFNVRGEPMVNSPDDAFECFMGTHMDVLAIGNCLLFKNEQLQKQDVSHASKFEPD